MRSSCRSLSDNLKKSRWVRFSALALAVILVFLILLVIGLKIYGRYLRPPMPVIAATEHIRTDKSLNSNINVLIMGKDNGGSGDSFRQKNTDVMIVASFDTHRQKFSLLSVPRDTMVTIPGRPGQDKINAAYFYGGPKLAEATVADLLLIPINYYMLIDWQAFIDIVDILGGVKINVERDMDYEDPEAGLSIHLKKGFQHLNGTDAGKYIRFRADGQGDIGRVHRQQKFLHALVAQGFSLRKLLRLPVFFAVIPQYAETDIDKFTLLQIADCFKFRGRSKVSTAVLSGQPRTVNKRSYWVTSPAMIKASLDKLPIPNDVIVPSAGPVR